MNSPLSTTNYQSRRDGRLPDNTSGLSVVPKIVFFGTPELVVPILDELKSADLTPSLIVTGPDRKKGRGLILTPPPAKVWAEKNHIPILQPEKLDSDFLYQLQTTKADATVGSPTTRRGYQLFIVVAYGKILSQEIIDLPEYGTYNIHYSLLPKYRGATPVESAILNGDKKTGVAIQQMVYELDAGPILSESKTEIGESETAPVLRNRLNDIAKLLLVETIKKIIAGTATSQTQNNSEATYCKKIKKEDGLIDLNDRAIVNYRKYRAYFGWPGTYFFTEKKGRRIRVIIKVAEFINGEFKIKTVLPEGKNEIDYQIFLQGTYL